MRRHPKHATIDTSNPEALGICDLTGFVFNRKDLVQQMEWRGNALVWTGLYVGRPYAHKPNEQFRVMPLPPDPVPIKDPRPPKDRTITFAQGFGVPFNQLNFCTFDSWESLLDGTPALPNDQRLTALQTVRWN